MSELAFERRDAIVFGRKIGTTTGWNFLDWDQWMAYDFDAEDGIDLPSGDLCVNFDTGIVEIYEPESGDVVVAKDLIEVFQALPRVSAVVPSMAL